MAAISNRELENFVEIIKHFKQDERSHDIYTFIVLEVQRYTLDPDFKSKTGSNPGSQTEAYDVTISDLHQKTKCLLHPKNNPLIQKWQLRTGSLINLCPANCRVYCDELDLGAEPIVIIDEVDIQGVYNEPVLPIRFCPQCGKREKENLPLVTGRGSYSALWNNEDPTHPVWRRLDPQQYAGDPLLYIADLANSWRRLPRPYGCLVVRVLHKHRLNMYAKHTLAVKYPHHLTIDVADVTGRCTIVFWGECCLDLLYSIHEGTVLAIRSYTVREPFLNRPRPTVRDNNIIDCGIDIQLNKPGAEITIVDPASIKPAWRLPEIIMECYTRRHISALPDEYNIDVIAVVLSIGRHQRIRKKQYTPLGKEVTEGHEFWNYRWIILMDETSPSPIVYQLFATSQPQTHSAIVPGSVLMLTQSKVCRHTLQLTGARIKNTFYLISTNLTQVYIVNANSPKWILEHPRVIDTRRWRATNACQGTLVRGASIGGAPPKYPPHPYFLAQYKETFTEENPLKLTTAIDLQPKLDTLCFRETICVNIQCYLVNVRYVSGRPQETLVPTQTQTGVPSTDPSSEDDDSGPSIIESPIKLRSGRSISGDRKHQRLPTHLDPGLLPTQTQPQNDITIDDCYPDIVQQTAVIGSRQIHTTSVCRAYNFRYGDRIVAAHLQMPSDKYTPINGIPSLEEIPARMTQDYLTLTFVGLNHDTTIITHLLLPEKLTPNSSLIGLLSGMLDSSPHTPVGGVTNPQTPEERHDCVHGILQSALHLRGVRILVVLDVCCHEQSEELLVNRGYPVLE